MYRSSVVKFMAILGVSILLGWISATTGLVFAQRLGLEPQAVQVDVVRLKATVEALSNDVKNLSAQLWQLKQAQQGLEAQYQKHAHKLNVGVIKGPAHDPNTLYLFTTSANYYNTGPPIP